MQKKLCFGGSFNPIHHGHLICVRAVAEAVGAETVVLFPTGNPPHKPQQANLAAAEDRVAMCRMAVAHNPLFEIDDRETRRAGPSYTIQTIRELKLEGWEQVAWVIGADMLNILPTWHEAEALLDEAVFHIMGRPGWSFAWQSLPPAFGRLRDQVVETPRIDISSTEIRRRVGRGQAVDYLTPPVVCQYIHEHGLYRKG